MKIIQAGYQIMDPIIENAKDYIYKKIERVGRTCYKSEDRITEDSAAKFITNLIKRGHEAMLEHASMTIKFTVDRGVTHEAVRHRLSSFAQESTRYCNYSQDKFGNEITVIEPVFYATVPNATKDLIRWYVDNGELGNLACLPLRDLEKRYGTWYWSCLSAETAYFQMLKREATPEEARNVLPSSVKADLIWTANMREWRHILNLRAAGVTGKPHPQMSEVMVPLLGELKVYMPELFGDIPMPEEEE